MTGDRSKVQCCKEQYCIGTCNVRSMNQGKLEVKKQEMARANINILRRAQSQGPDSQAGVLLPPGVVHGEGCCERVLGVDSVGSCSWWEGNVASIGALVALAGTC